MNDLTTILFDNCSGLDVEEKTKASTKIEFDNGAEQIISGFTVPSITLTIQYNNISQSVFDSLTDAYEDNHSNTFKAKVQYSGNLVGDVYTNPLIPATDLRGNLLSENGSTWVFTDFNFTTTAQTLNRFSGKITILTSLFFNFEKYTELFSESSSYRSVTSVDNSFYDYVLDYVMPYQMEIKYYKPSLMSKIGNSARHTKDKNGLRKNYVLSFFCNESLFLNLLKFYRKKSGMLGTFGVGTLVYNEDIKKTYRFVSDSLQYQTDYKGMVSCSVEIMESN